MILLYEQKKEGDAAIFAELPALLVLSFLTAQVLLPCSVYAPDMLGGNDDSGTG